MNKAISRFMRMDDWVFEIKTVRALKVDSYGQPYKAIAHFNLNGDFAIMDGAMHGSDNQFSEQDRQTFLAMCQQLGISDLRIDNRQDIFPASGDNSPTPTQRIA